jgi:hypothetical protein
MCLLITQKASAPALSDQWLSDFFDYNSDGVGVMYAQGGQLIIEKVLPKNDHQWIAFYREHIEGRECAYHLRMRTHGHTDLENCHPYEVLNMAEHGRDLWLMHNGVLATGNAADLTKSDTWHYIRDFLRPMLASNPEYAFTNGFADIIGQHIGVSNKFVLMDNLGHKATINESSGVYWAGLWLSNTYAWTASKNASKKPVKNRRKQLKQSKEIPAARTYPRYGYGGRTAIGYMDGYGSYDEDGGGLEYDPYDDIEMIMNEIELSGFEKAATVPISACMDFADNFGFDSFSEIAYMLLDGNIGEDWFIKVMRDDIAAREAFPWLDRAAYGQRGYSYA